MCKIDGQGEAAVKQEEVSLGLCDDLQGWGGGGRREA